MKNKTILKKDYDKARKNLIGGKLKGSLFIYDDNFTLAKMAKINVKDHNLYLEQPKGKLKSSSQKENVLDYSANFLFWNSFENTLF